MTIDRQRPYLGAGSGHFFAGGSSFPSEHAAVSWAVAGVMAHDTGAFNQAAGLWLGICRNRGRGLPAKNIFRRMF